MSKELVIIYDTPSMTHTHIISIHNLTCYFNFFDKIRVLYWSKEENIPGIFGKEGGKFIFYPYFKPYNSGYITGLKYMTWIGKTLWKICGKTSKETELIFMPVIPIWSGIPTLIVGRLKRKKVVLRLEAAKIDYLALEEKLANRPKIFSFIKVSIIKLIYYLTLPFYDFIIGLSEGITKEAKSYGAKKIETIPIPINITPFLSKEKVLRSEKPTILYVGQIKNTKGIDILIKAMRLFKNEENLSPKLLIAGGITNPKDESFFREIKQLSNGLDVEFLGWIEYRSLPEIYNRADIFVLPSYSEALGLVIMEAMASGLPVIATKTSGAKELVEDGENGFLVPVKNPAAIKEKIKILLESPELRESMGRAGRKRIEELMKIVDENNKKLWNLLLKE